mmetsp:Transcript_53461/g.153396  ORF Transcript_53461/g.153396 Transcript_53461/m.153396 type:complete len:205 (-) Transcript_53461:18-632(-)
MSLPSVGPSSYSLPSSSLSSNSTAMNSAPAFVNDSLANMQYGHQVLEKMTTGFSSIHRSTSASAEIFSSPDASSPSSSSSAPNSSAKAAPSTLARALHCVRVAKPARFAILLPRRVAKATAAAAPTKALASGNKTAEAPSGASKLARGVAAEGSASPLRRVRAAASAPASAAAQNPATCGPPKNVATASAISGRRVGAPSGQSI